MANILVVDDEHGIRELLFEILDDEGHHVIAAQNAAEARQARLNARPDLVLLDIWMPDTDGVSLLKEWSASGLLDMPVIMMSGHATIETAVEATRIGAMAFLEKPITMQKLLASVEQGLTKGARQQQVKAGELRGVVSAPPVGGVGQTAMGTTVGQAVVNSPLSNIEAFSAGMSLAQISADQLQSQSPAANIQSFELDKPLRDARDQFEKSYFEYHLIQEGGSMTRVAEKTGLERTHLYRKLKQLGIDLSKAKKGQI
ncbi:response regulator [Burkholderiaceae bacterium]|nr:response regulator [Burkholderiaceae bacterium]